MPLGLAASPILSDIYLHEFDGKMEKICKRLQLKYTRYADDILISSKEIINDEKFVETDRFLKKALKVLGLGINEEKFLRLDFGSSANHISYVGINIVHGKSENYLSVGKTYIYEAYWKIRLYQTGGRYKRHGTASKAFEGI